MSNLLARASALVLAIAGLALLFAPDVVLSRLSPGIPAGTLWLAQLLAAALLALAALDWLQRGALLGGIYGRPTVLPNAAFHFVGALSAGRAAAATTSASAAPLWGVALVLGAFALAWGWLLFRGPAERDFAAHQAIASRAA